MENDYLMRMKPLKALLLFSLPIIIGNLFQQTYTMVDSAVVGRFVGEKALAAVGASYAFTSIFICIAVGGGIGASVVVSRYFGAREYAKMKSAVSTSFIAFLLVSFVLGGIGLLFGRRIMALLNTPADVLDTATSYLSIYFLGLPFLFMYNIVSSMFNALGKSRIPLYFLIFSSVFNVVLDVVAVTRFKMGVEGVAWATVIAQGLSAVFSFLVFRKVMNRLDRKKEKFFDGAELISMTKIALPSILQQSTVFIGLMLVQSVVNSFGSEVLAGFSAAMRIESLCIVPMVGIGNALSSYTAQNIGAGELGRVVGGYRAANLAVVVSAVLICLVLENFYTPIIAVFMSENATAVAVATGEGFLTFMGWFFCLIGFKMAVDGLLRGAGDMTAFTIANLVNLFIRVFLAVTLAPKYGIEMVWFAVPIGWLANWVISFRQYRTGKWKTIFSPEKNECAVPLLEKQAS